IVERPKVAAKFDASKEPFSFDELDELISPYYADRPPNEPFAAAVVLGLTRGCPAGGGAAPWGGPPPPAGRGGPLSA
ncbi:hypothetical protein ACYJ2M_39460, partial [Streptomyces sp. DT9]